MTKPGTTEVTVIRTVPAKPGEVFDVWLDSKSPGSPWFGVAKAIVNPIVDGLFYHLVQFEGGNWPHYGRFIELERPQRIQHTWVSEATRGLESIVTISLEAQADETLVTLHHANIPNDEMGLQHREGWGFVLAMLAERFVRQKG